MIFTWNGRSFQFVTDVLGVAPLGASSGDGQYFPVDHDEYVSIPAAMLQARDGKYEIRMTEELREVSYIDQIKLQALDQRVHYRDWMRQHRASWLSQSKTDFAWGLVAIVALKARDFETAGCWLRYTAGARGSAHWIVTDEVVHQILRKNKVSEAASDASCR